MKTKCWGRVQSITDWLAKNNLTEEGGYEYFVKRAAEIVLSTGHRPVQWEEVYSHFGTSLDKRTVVHVWKDKALLKNVTADGYSALINNLRGHDGWYLDKLNRNWDAFYSNEPCVGLTDKQCGLVLGGHGEMWGEEVDASDVDGEMWPRLASIAERLWSPRATTDAALISGEALRRIHVFRCLLNQRGIAAAPVGNANAREAPTSPSSCYDQ